MSVGDNIRRIREKAGLTQVYVAKQVGVTSAMLCQIERGTKNPSLQVGAEIAKVLGCSLESLLVGDTKSA
ncbi:MAG: helix-turn-helix transcriptional regulator [Hungatella sp.]|nr:helix-turn-helix transcriptional regulator [Hungatella sp.]